MDATVPLYPGLPSNSPFQERVYNLPAMERKRTYLVVSGVTAIVGAVLLGFGTLAKGRDRQPQNQNRE
jgi:hypothetical protein